MIATLRRAALAVGLAFLFSTPAYPWAAEGHRALALVAGLILGRRQRPMVDDEPSVMSPEYTS